MGSVRQPLEVPALPDEGEAVLLGGVVVQPLGVAGDGPLGSLSKKQQRMSVSVTETSVNLTLPEALCLTLPAGHWRWPQLALSDTHTHSLSHTRACINTYLGDAT